ncbi:MAG: hypothetical protein HUJ75_02940, partial [Parasporobacterium sp.]|nr:hypothetical protein [Parasporobacterium sp.]
MSEPARDNSAKKNSNKMPLLFGILIGSIILVYLIVYSISYFFGGNHSIYEVVSGSTQGMYEGYYTALALRDETIVTCKEDGFVSFFVGDGSEVNVGQQTYVIDKTGELSEKIKQAAEDKSILTSHNLTDIKNSIVDFDTVYNPDNYSDTYNFKNKLESNIMDMVNIAVFDEVSTNYSGKGSFNVVSSDISGILMH